ncbi:LuxR C-terminal-related transcriptional regulator [Roseovarius aestuarii]|uniref:DNA-binding transcriptional activator BglJ n=1 Tax=Roseovarius aestuarii TaxID=475083 RepID=A0A1X7BU67_9RHOB|nr:LuxR C-terminal-related transcriptional regulator [Roseovarius aestuarii]SMC13124.1 DNA-binding transcriptional activator BglJ [Roseovarius aestuarii]
MKPEISTKTIAKWQRIVDLIARVADVPASLIMRTDEPHHSVFVTSQTENNPYPVGCQFTFSEKLYCYGVLQNDGELVVEDAACDPKWADNDDMEYGMSFYIGYPLKWPDGDIFGTICVLDIRRNRRALLFREGLQEFARVIEADLELFTEMSRRIALEAELQTTLDELELRVTKRTADLEEANTALRVLLGSVEQAREEYDLKLLRQIKGLVMPHLARLRTRLDGDPKGCAYLDMAEEQLKSITANMSGQLMAVMENLTPVEREIAQMIMRGQSTKDIARTLSRGRSTIEFHRNNIRSKLGLRHSGKNLRSLLLSLH